MVIPTIVLIVSLGILVWLETQWYFNRQRLLRMSGFWVELVSSVVMAVAGISALYLVASIFK